MKRVRTRSLPTWLYIVGLILIFGLSLTLRAAEIVGPKSNIFSAHPLDDDSTIRLVAIQQRFNSLAQPPRLTIKLAAVDAPSLRYLILIDAGDRSDSPEVKKQLSDFEATMHTIRQAQMTPEQLQVVAHEGINVPILMYHRTPADFEQQIKHLVDHSYTGISFDELRLALLEQSPLPSKPVIITLDDGYTDQLHEINVLKKYNMKATLYMINGGAASSWCIGANAKSLPGCEPYLSWDQVRDLDGGGLITIGSHTINHPNLAKLNIDQQRTEIIGGKQELEKQLGHPIYDFAYPYGSFNEMSIQAVKEAGFLTAVTTQPGSVQTISNLFTLTRLRDSLVLP